MVSGAEILDIYKNSAILRDMKNKTTNVQLKIRSIFTSGMNLSNQIHRTKKGAGSYNRKNFRINSAY